MFSYKKIISIFIFLIISLCCVSVVSAADNTSFDKVMCDDIGSSINNLDKNLSVDKSSNVNLNKDVANYNDDSKSSFNELQKDLDSNNNESTNDLLNETYDGNDSSIKSFDEIQDKINNANELDVIYLNGTYKGNGTPIFLSGNNLTIDGQNKTILDAQGLSNIFRICGDNVKLVNMVLINGNAYLGGAIELFGKNWYINGCNFTHNVACYGGAIFVIGSGFVSGCNFMYNLAECGGAIYISKK